MKALLVLLALGLLIYAVLDCSKAREDEMPSGMPRAGWLLVIILIPLLGPVFWIIASRTEPTSGGHRPPGTTRSPKTPKAPSGPDDDPDFLRGL